jgi:signal transduction histidine kinase/uncharacterized membrane protein YciS (DUF1049 family)
LLSFDVLRNWAVKARKTRLSTCVIVLFAVALVLPWCAFAWITLSDRSEHLERVERGLAQLAAAYGEHAATLMSLGVAVPMEGDTPTPDVGGSTRRGEEDMAAFRRALDVPDVHLSLRRIGSPATLDDPTPLSNHEDGILRAEAARPGTGFVTVASLSEDTALEAWRDRTHIGTIGLLLRTLFAAGIGAALVQQLRWREEAQAQLAKAREAAESSNRIKSAFLAHMSHELRTPLNAIIGFSDVIKMGMLGPLNPRYREYGGDIFNSGTHLLHLINDVLDLSKLDAGEFKLYEEDVDLSTVMRVAMRLVRSQAEKSGSSCPRKCKTVFLSSAPTTAECGRS